MTKKAVIFDMDGVLFDTESFYYKRREDFLNTKGISIKHLPPSFFVGGNMKQIWQKVLGNDYANWDIEQLQLDYKHYKDTHRPSYKTLIFADVKKVLRQLSQNHFKLSLASNSAKSDILLALREAKIEDYFDLILSGEEFSEGKPNPAIYNELADRLALPKSELLIVEDSEKGIAAGVAAGIDVWAIEDRLFGINQKAANRLVSNLTQVADLLLP